MDEKKLEALFDTNCEFILQLKNILLKVEAP